MAQFKNNLEKLKLGCFMRGTQKENTEPENQAIGQISKELRFLQRQSEYVTEIERILKELRLTLLLIKNVKTSTINEAAEISKQDLLIYYQGTFLTLIHQTKDHIIQLVNLLTETTIPEKPSIEKDVSVSDLLKKKIDILKSIGIENEIKEWEQEHPTSKVSVALRKRSHYHHKISGLRYDKDYQNLSFTDIASTPQFQEMLSDYGKQDVVKMRRQSMERLFSGAELKAKETLTHAEQNIEKIAERLLAHFKLPISDREIADIMAEHYKINDSFKIININSFEKIPAHLKQKIDQLSGHLKTKFNGIIEAMYLVGSTGRGEYMEGYSDINLYLILKDSECVEERVDDIINSFPHDEEFNIRIFGRSMFMQPEAKKYRIIAKADGLLIFGDDLTKNEKLPKAGLFTALTLNDDIIENLNEATKWIKNNPQVTPMQISKKSRKLAKRIIDFMYGVVMSNKPQYTSSRRERVAKISDAYPKNISTIKTLVGVSRYGVGELESFKNLVEGFRPKAEKNLNSMIKIKEHIESQPNYEEQ